MITKIKKWDSPQKRFFLVKVILFILPCILLLRAFQVQIIGDERLKRLSKAQFRSKILIRPTRGLIYDRNKQPLTMNGEAKSLALNPKKIKGNTEIVLKISRALKIPYKTLSQKVSAKKDFLWVRRHLTERDMTRLHKEKLIENAGSLIDGMWIVTEDKRVYPHGEVASPVIGTVNLDLKGREGLELFFNEKLQGEKKSVAILRDSFGRKAFLDTKNIQDNKNGESIQLTLDIPLQYSVEKKLKQAILSTQSLSGSVIVMNAENGEILALANYPMFDPRKKSGSFEARRNRVVTDGYEPGSTLKPLLMAAALREHMGKKEKVWGGLGEFVLQGRKITEAETHERFEWLTLEEMVTLSSNVGAAKFALKLGAEKYVQALKDLGFAAKTQIEFPGEISGRIPEVKGMQPLTLANIGFGQGLFSTPLQVTRAYATLINGGRLVQPKIILDSSEDETEKGHLELLKPLWSPQVIQEVQSALKKVVKDGTGKKAQIPGYVVAGKTGTSQVVDPKTRKYSQEHYFASFVGFPLDVQQKIVIYTQLNRPQGVFYASETAAPLFKEVLLEVISRFRIPHNPLLMPPSEVPESKTTPVIGKNVQEDSLQIQQSSLKPVTHEEMGRKILSEFLTMPDLSGLTPHEAIQKLSGKPVNVKILGSGLIYDQTPEAGVVIKEGQRVFLKLKEK